MSLDESRSGASPEWWSANLYVEQKDALDFVVARAAPWLGAVAAEIGAQRWFFVRYFDMRGHHLRLRVRAQPESIDDLCERAGELVALARVGTGDRVAPSFIPDPMIPDILSCPAFVTRVYAPEYVKYGGVSGIEVAEALFTWTSSWYVANQTLDVPRFPDRAAFALALGREINRVLPAGAGDRLWPAHFRRWGQRLRGLGPVTGEGVESVRNRVRAELEPMVTTHQLGAEGVAAQIVDSLAAMSGRLQEVKPLNVLLDYFHMEMNRIGLNPVEECIVGTLVNGRPQAPSRTVPERRNVEVTA